MVFASLNLHPAESTDVGSTKDQAKHHRVVRPCNSSITRIVIFLLLLLGVEDDKDRRRVNNGEIDDFFPRRLVHHLTLSEE